VESTISIGIKSANITSDSGTEVTKLIGEADLALLKAKSNGRNRVEVFNNCFNTEKVKSPNLNPQSYSNNISANIAQ